MIILEEVDDLEVIYLTLETVYTLIKKSCLTGKFTKAHETPDHKLIGLVYMIALGFNFLSDRRMDLSDCMSLEQVIGDKEVKFQRFKRVKKGNNFLPSLSYFKIPFGDLETMTLPDNKPKLAKNIAKHFVKLNELNEG